MPGKMPKYNMVDVDELMADAREWVRTKRRNTHTPESIRKCGEARRRQMRGRVATRRAVAQALADDPILKRPRGDHLTPYGARRRDRILMGMQPGEWHTAAEIAERIGLPVKTTRIVMRQGMAGLIEKAENADYLPNRIVAANMADGFPAATPGEARYFHRLTAEGGRERDRVLRAAAGPGGGASDRWRASADRC